MQRLQNACTFSRFILFVVIAVLLHIATSESQMLHEGRARPATQSPTQAEVLLYC